MFLWLFAFVNHTEWWKLYVKLHEKSKATPLQPWTGLRVPGGWGSQISRQSTHEGDKVVSPTHRPPLSQEISLVLISVRGWIDPRATVRSEGFYQWKIPMTPSENEIATFRLQPQPLPQPTAPPQSKRRSYILKTGNILKTSIKHGSI